MHLEYAKALFSLTEENGSTDTVKSELSYVNEALAQNPQYLNIQDTPAIPKEEKLNYGAYFNQNSLARYGQR